jgi:hypothetical protein
VVVEALLLSELSGNVIGAADGMVPLTAGGLINDVDEEEEADEVADCSVELVALELLAWRKRYGK